jgi:hypothetical protein
MGITAARTPRPILSAVSFKEKKEMLRSLVASEIGNKSKHSSVIIESLTEKLMANDFNQTFYQGNGKTNGDLSQTEMYLSSKLKVKLLIKGLGFSLFTIMQVALKINRSKKSLSLGWVYGIPPQYYATANEITKLEKFLDSTLGSQQIGLPSTYYLQSGKFKNPKETDRIKVVPHLGSMILSIGNQSKFKTILQLVGRTIAWLGLSARYPLLLMIGPEYLADIPSMELIETNEVFKNQVLITTQSHLLAPPLVFKSSIKADRIMYWYSDNSVQITSSSLGVLDYTYLTQSQISKHFVWTQSWGDIVKKNNMNSDVIPLGPVMFRNLDAQSMISRIDSNGFYTVTIFDVTPKNIASADSIYSEKVMIKFLSDIVEVVKNKYPLARINLKPKRMYSSSDSLVYRNFVLAQSSRLNVLSWDCDIFDQILNSNLVICIPFTSPGLISSYLGIQTAYYVPSLEFNLEDTHESIPVLQGRESLGSFLDKLQPNAF